jgi:hypothetical protein
MFVGDSGKPVVAGEHRQLVCGATENHVAYEVSRAAFREGRPIRPCSALSTTPAVAPVSGRAAHRQTGSGLFSS